MSEEEEKMGAFTYEIVDNCIAVVTFNNPPVNALGLQEKKDSIDFIAAVTDGISAR